MLLLFPRSRAFFPFKSSKRKVTPGKKGKNKTKQNLAELGEDQVGGVGDRGDALGTLLVEGDLELLLLVGGGGGGRRRKKKRKKKR